MLRFTSNPDWEGLQSTGHRHKELNGRLLHIINLINTVSDRLYERVNYSERSVCGATGAITIKGTIGGNGFKYPFELGFELDEVLSLDKVFSPLWKIVNGKPPKKCKNPYTGKEVLEAVSTAINNSNLEWACVSVGAGGGGCASMDTPAERGVNISVSGGGKVTINDIKIR